VTRSHEQYDYSTRRSSHARSSIYLDYNEYHGEIHPKTQHVYFEGINLLKTYFRPGDTTVEKLLSELLVIDARNLFLVSGADHALEEILSYCKNHLNLQSYSSFHQTTYDHFYTFAHKLSLKNESIEKAEILYVCCPNNPDGTILSAEECVSLVSRYGEKMFIFDLSYLSYSNETYSSYLNAFKNLPNVFVLSSLAKIYPISGLRAGWFYSSHVEAKKFFTTFLNAKMLNPLSRKVLESCLEEDEFYRKQIEEIFMNRPVLAEIVIEFLKRKHIPSCLKYDIRLSSGNFFSLQFSGVEHCEAAIDALNAVGLIVRAKGHWDFIRITSVNDCLLSEIVGRLL
jgi:histidinol-phosphate/aromatic aminotransferase/cobyric acid decarboxylase-like protein